MGNKSNADWDPRSETVLKDQIAAYDSMRRRCPIAYSEYLGWTLFRHQDIVRVLDDHKTFSNAVSSHLSVPNGMDPPVHTQYRRLIEPYFSDERMADFAPTCRNITRQLVSPLASKGGIDFMSDFAENFALQIQSAFMGWPEELHQPLRLWIRKNQQATLAQDRAAMKTIALEFDGYIKELLSTRREVSTDMPGDLTSQLLNESVGNRPLNDEEIVSILRNWTVGELATISASVGILAHYLAKHVELQQQLRQTPALIPAAIDEILRIHAPLIANRRITTQPVIIAGRRLEAGERVSILWASANRDETVFGDPDEFNLNRDPKQNLLYGAGIHVCPGAPLARLELGIFLEELLNGVRRIELIRGQPPTKAIYPASGFVSLPLQFN